MNQKEQPLKILMFAASLREGSLNEHLIKLASDIIMKNGGIPDLAYMKDFECQSFNGDMEGKSGIDPGAGRFQQRLMNNDALIIAAPEYNGSMPGYLKNTIDWVSRFRPQPFNERQVLLLSASPSMAGGSHGLWSLRIPLEHLGARVYPDMFSLAVAHKAFKDDTIADPVLAKRFQDTIVGFLKLAEAQKNYPCVKTVWVEFLGEKTDSVTDRVEK
ncbi:MAG TPA: NAD(P)H-dependent oxidoreductase [Bacteroidia bacterium]|jgi:chromate reductase|nr:NAD(P)H-dependent oxidoreductase [Bacteroidia bacterium]